MVILDTSFLVAYFREMDVHHAKALQRAEELRGEKMVITFLVFQELASILNRKVSTEFATSVTRKLLSPDSNIELFKLDESFFEEVLELYGKLGPHSFSYVDVSLIHLSKELELSVLTFDKELEKALSS
jgi:predicted nucleic acid-binding protein